MSSDAYTEAWLAGPQSTQFYTRTYTAPPSASKAVLVFIHGFADHVGRYTAADAQFSARGINVFTFDQRGFGKTALDAKRSKTSSYGKTSGKDQMDDIKWALDHAAKEFPGLPIFLSGHSMGGGEVLTFATRGVDVSFLSGIIACSPLILQTKPASKLARWAGGRAAALLPHFVIPAPLDYNDLSHDAEYNKIVSTDPLAKLQGTLRGISDMLNGGEHLLYQTSSKWPKSLPILFCHGSGDHITSHTATQAFHDKIVADDKKVIMYEGAYHELVQEPEHKEKLINDMVAFIEEHSAPKPAVAAEMVESKL
ncbi:Alpha/Beta hydrolase protein [Mycena sp. CBHHK59/15]|nr:Alpha/Beta hydrolase protein [Mycena sp. CBHHK59/15]